MANEIPVRLKDSIHHPVAYPAEQINSFRRASLFQLLFLSYTGVLN